jgi:D-sedoheptulose 7-phosphate isomerase
MIDEHHIIEYLDDSIACIEQLKTKVNQINRVIEKLEWARKQGKKVFLMGNGGSASLASHLICDFNKFRRLKAIALTDSMPLITAWSNDDDYSVVFQEQLRTLADSNDVVIGISGSGNSPNIIKGIEFAKQIGCYTIGFAGFDGGKLAKVADECITIEVNNMQHSEDIHTLLGHLITFLMTEAE